MSVKINSFEIENVKRVKAVQLQPKEDGLTVIGGGNSQGKTSVLDAIAWALGGDRKRPTNAKREGAARDPRLKVVLSNGIVVERRGKNSALHVIDPEGNKSGQKLLDAFVGQLALDLPKFMAMNSREKADELLKVIGIGEELAALEDAQAKLEVRRLETGRIARQKRGAAEELPMFADAPDSEVSASELIKEQQEILARNGQKQRDRDNAAALAAAADNADSAMFLARDRVEQLRRQLADAVADFENKQEQAEQANERAREAEKTSSQLEDESTAEIEASIEGIDRINEQVRANMRRAAAIADADQMEAEYDDLDAQVNAIREKKHALLEGADLPLPGLSVEDGAIVYNGQQWDCMSSSEQLKVATAIVRAVKPECGFVLVDRLEQMDPTTLSEFGAWAEAQGLQVIGTRVADDETCTIVIEDGYVTNKSQEAAQAPTFNFPGKE
jgi:hypothetical protein